MMKSPRSPRRHALLAALILVVLVVLGFVPALAQRAFFSHSQVMLPYVIAPRAPTSVPTTKPTPDPHIVAWLDIPAKVRINERMTIIVHVENQSRTVFDGKTVVTIPYDGRRFYAVDSSFTSGKGDWVKQNSYPNQLVVEFGPLGANEQRKGTIYYDFHANSANGRVGDRLRIEGNFNNGRPECGSDICDTNERTVEVVDQFTTGGGGTLPDGSKQTQKLGSLRYSDLHRWVPSGFRPGEQVTTWLNLPGGGTQALTLQQKADSAGKVYFNIDLSGLRNGFYSIVAHGKDTRIEIIGEFQIVGSPITSLANIATHPFLLPLPAPAAEARPSAGLMTRPAQAIGSATLTGVVAAAGTNGQTRLEGVQVNVVAADNSVVGATASDAYGAYMLSGLPPGTYAVSFDPHFSLSDVARRFQPLTQANVSVSNNATTQLDAELTAGSSISGRVTGAAEGGLVDVSVLLLNGAEVVEATTTTDDGRYVLDGIPSGTYTLRFDPSSAEDALVQSFAITTSAAFTLAAPNPLGGQDVELSRTPENGVITGQVVAADTGAPLVDVFVAFERFDTTSGQFAYTDLALTDETGEYSAVLPAGDYHVSFLPGFSTDPTSALYLNKYYNNASDPASATQLTINNGDTARADAALTLGGTIAGTVSGDSNPLVGVLVLTYDAANNTLVDIALTADDGTYRTAGLAAGNYRVEFVTFLSDDSTTQRYAGTTVVELIGLDVAANVSGIDGILGLGGTISGTVTSGEGGSLGDVLVLGIDPQNAADVNDDQLAGFALTDATGAYTMTGLVTGSYTVLFDTALTGTPDVAAHFDQYYNGKASDTAADPVAVTAGGTTTGINAALTRGGQIRGIVRDAVGNFSVPGVLVTIAATTDPTTPVTFAVTDEQGAYASSALTTGVLYVVYFDPQFISDEAGYADEYFNNAPDVATAQPVSVPNIIPITGIDAALEAAP